MESVKGTEKKNNNIIVKPVSGAYVYQRKKSECRIKDEQKELSKIKYKH